MTGKKVEEIFQNVEQEGRGGKYEGKVKRCGGLIRKSNIFLAEIPETAEKMRDKNYH